MFGFIGQTVAGGWNAITNIAAGIGKGASTFVSGFFPAPQRDKVTGGSPAQAEGAGETYRFTQPENISMGLTRNFAQQDWIASPYEAQYAVPAKVQESRELAAKISPGKDKPKGPIETLVGVATWGTKQATGIKTAADEFMITWGLKKREPISEGPKETGASRGAVQHVDDGKETGADVFEAVKGIGQYWEQVKGLFNLGFGQTGSQPVFSIQHELEPKTKITAGMAVAAIILAIIIFGRKR